MYFLTYGLYLINSGLYFVKKIDNFCIAGSLSEPFSSRSGFNVARNPVRRPAIKLHTSFVPIIVKIRTKKVPIKFHISSRVCSKKLRTPAAASSNPLDLCWQRCRPWAPPHRSRPPRKSPDAKPMTSNSGIHSFSLFLCASLRLGNLRVGFLDP